MYEIEEKTSKRIKDFWPTADISILKTPICDLLVHFYDTNLSFVIEVKLKTASNDILNNYRHNVTKAIISQGAPKIPLIIALYDENADTVDMGIAISWRLDTPIIDKNISYLRLNEETKDRILDNIKAADSVIRMLSSTNCKVIKTISFSFPMKTINQYDGKVMYLRDLSSGYRMNCRKEISEEERFDRLLHGIPQDEYPNDQLDELVLQAIQNVYPNAKVKSNLLLFSSELCNLQREIKSSHQYECTITIIPQMDDIYPLNFEGIELLSFPIDVYIDMMTTKINLDKYFSVEIKTDSIEQYKQIYSKLKTMKRVQDLV